VEETTITAFRRILAVIVIALAVVVSDQCTKQIVTTLVPMNRAVEVIPGYFNLVHARNPGAAFGIMADSQSRFRSVFLLLVSAAALVIILWTVLVSGDAGWLMLTACGLFFGGALGNLVDRVRFGEVVDFLDFHVGALHWPAFNVADSALCIGTGLLFIHFLVSKKQAGHKG
jgi:signal peptidase II